MLILKEKKKIKYTISILERFDEKINNNVLILLEQVIYPSQSKSHVSKKIVH